MQFPDLKLISAYPETPDRHYATATLQGGHCPPCLTAKIINIIRVETTIQPVIDLAHPQ